MKVVYNFSSSLENTLNVIAEVMSETGLEPDHIELDDGSVLKFNARDVRQLYGNEMTEAEYIARHRIK